jgi:hypothetical protein
LRNGAQWSWALILRPFEMGIAAKSGDFDESVVIDRADLSWLDSFLGVLQRRPARRMIWDFTQAQYTAQVLRLAALARLEVLKVDTYSLRHGGASADALEGRRPLREIKKRGRWKSDASVRRYETASVALHQVQLIPPEILEFAKVVDRNLGPYFMGEWKPQPPPVSRRAAVSSAS